MTVELALIANGKSYTGFKTIDIKKSIEDLSGSFTITMSGSFDSDTPIIKPQSTCVLTLVNPNGDSESVITGFVDRVSINIKKDNHEVTIIGRDKAADLIDCSVVNSSGQYLNLTVEKIIGMICEPFGINVTLDPNVGSTGDPLKVFAVEQGMSAFEAIQKVCKIRRLLCTSDGLGGILITRAGNNAPKSGVLEGVNLLEGTADYDFSNRFSIYYCKGQQPGDSTTAISTVIGSVGSTPDSAVTRYRPILIIAEGQATTQDCKDRSQWEQAVRLGKSQRYTVTVNGWDDPLTGTLWTANEVITLKSTTLGVFDNLLVMSVNYTLSDKGQLTIMELTPASAYQTYELDTSNAATNAYLQS